MYYLQLTFFNTLLIFIMKDLKEIVSHFDTKGTISEIKPLGNGLINDTYVIRTEEVDAPDYVMQRINHSIFTDLDCLMDNIEAVTKHLRKKLEEAGENDIDRKVLHFISVPETGKKYYFDGDSYWRIMTYIPRSATFETVDAKYSNLAGKAFGKFQAMLADIPDTLRETIPNFHNMEFRMQQLHDAIKENRSGRADEVKDLIAEVEKRADDMCRAERLYREGKLPKRICHCDTKVNNMLFDEGGDVLCVIDLDTVMPSFVFSDYGDFLRTAANTGLEDDPNLDNIDFDMEIFKAFTSGYLESAKSFLTPAEIENLPYAAALFPYQTAVRFLADYINGDIYFKTQYPEHNKVRTRAQLRLVEQIEKKMPQMQEYINGFLK